VADVDGLDDCVTVTVGAGFPPPPQAHSPAAAISAAIPAPAYRRI